jgi:hypothetical protein
LPFKVADPRLMVPVPTYQKPYAQETPMQILRQKSSPTATDDLYSISDVKVVFPADRIVERFKGEEGKVRTEGTLHVLVDLEPEVYLRERGFGTSLKRRKTPARSGSK